MEGIGVGATVGIAEGAMDGDSVGDKVGSQDGSSAEIRDENASNNTGRSLFLNIMVLKVTQLVNNGGNRPTVHKIHQRFTFKKIQKKKS